MFKCQVLGACQQTCHQSIQQASGLYGLMYLGFNRPGLNGLMYLGFNRPEV